VLFTVASEPVLSSDFIRVYQKNLELVKDENQKDIDAYLSLFIKYKLKVKEARTQGLDKDPQYLAELKSYRKQLAKKLFDRCQSIR
jgi:peptidyl-prolyl cis-trans isomerase SurA